MSALAPVNRALIIGATIAMVGAAGAAIALAPRDVYESAPSEPLAAVIPATLGDWREMASPTQQVSLFAVDEEGGNPMQKVYDDSLLRTYVDGSGRQMMVAIAYDRVQREEDRVHRPEICYIAQGFHIVQDQPVTFTLHDGGVRSIEGRRMLTRNGNRLEAVSYWIRIGTSFTQNPWRSRYYVIAEGLAGRLHDGILVRVSEIVASPQDANASFARQEQFLGALLAGLPAPGVQQLASNAR